MFKHARSVFLAALIAAGFAGAAHAQEAGGKAKGPMKSFERLDRNDDGVVDRAEYEASIEKFFKRADADGDGVVDADEAKKAVEKAAARKAKAGEKMEKRLRRLDDDKDGKVTRAEALAPQGWFKRADKDGDGKVSKADLEETLDRRRDGDEGKDRKERKEDRAAEKTGKDAGAGEEDDGDDED